MKLFTLQPKEVFEILKTQDFNADPKLGQCANDEMFKRAYDYIMQHMQNISNPQNALTPVWAYYKIDGKNSIDLRTFSHAYEKGYYCLYLDVPDNEVFLTDFDYYHYVLNDWVIDDNATDAEIDEQFRLRDSNYSEFEKLARPSWERIFDVQNSKTVQATFWTLKREYIIKYKTFGRL